MIVKVDLERRAPTVAVDIVDIFLGDPVIVDGHAMGAGRRTRYRRIGWPDAPTDNGIRPEVGHLPWHVTHVTASMVIVSHQAYCDLVAHRDIDETLDGATAIALAKLGAPDIKAAIDAGVIRFVRDDAHGAGE